MRVQLIMGAFGIFIIGTMTSLICSGIWFGETERTLMNQLAGLSVVHINAFGGWDLMKNAGTWFSAFCTMLMWTYPYLDNTVGFTIKLTLLYPVSLGVVWGLVQVFIGAVQGFAGLVGNILSMF